MPFAYSNDGVTMRAVDENSVIEPGEVVFPDYATEAQLRAAFPNRAAVALSMVQTHRVSQADDIADALRAKAAGTVNPTRLQTLREKYDVAIAALANDAAAIAALTQEATDRGITVTQLATLIKNRGDTYRSRLIQIDTVFERHRRAIEALTTIADVRNYNINAGWPAF